MNEMPIRGGVAPDVRRGRLGALAGGFEVMQKASANGRSRKRY